MERKFFKHRPYISFSFVAEDQFKVQVTNVPNNSKLPLDVLRMHIHRQKFCLTNGAPPKVLAIWQISDLRKFGVVDKKFIFEGGSNCGKGKSSAKSGVFFFTISISPQMFFYIKLSLSLLSLSLTFPLFLSFSLLYLSLHLFSSLLICFEFIVNYLIYL